MALADELLVPGRRRAGCRPARPTYCGPPLTREVARTVALTSTALLCFSANSILCRLALAPKLIDPASFTTVRILSAVAMLTVSVWLKHRHLPRPGRAKPRSVAAVFIYLLFFSFAYTRLGAATGALVLIGAVQLTMLCIAVVQGERFSFLSWTGFGIAVAGVLWLLLPGATAPDPLGAALMAVSGTAWGFFTVFARGADHPEETNASNMLWCLLPALLVNLLWLDETHGTAAGLVLAAASGAIATGFGYIVWYLALRHLLVTQATIVQLSMPAVVALAGVVFLAEPLTARLLVASAAMLGGIAIALIRRPVRPVGRLD
ncbi:MAG: DMT family transporter [Alphaproteobacteria bacterium]|nr:MAG: DMT family transporter [Alphaproteobacteria bacterium]